jgi:tRNA1Val (adenine37-N6)-methyltransferase
LNRPSAFQFQQFAVRQEKSAMKVCTDATLFGAMAPVKPGMQVLDIGTGTGLLALMAAQLGAAGVTGVEINQDAFEEARCNFDNSPWRESLQAVQGSIQEYAKSRQRRYDLILSNPPFFQDHSKTLEPYRRQARHTDQLPHSELIACLNGLLADQGLCYLLLPIHAKAGFSQMALEHAGLHLNAETAIQGHPHNRPKVVALTFSREHRPVRHTLLTIYRTERVYSAESEAYLKPFLLRFAENEAV